MAVHPEQRITDGRIAFYFCAAGRGSIPEQKKYGHYVREEQLVTCEKEGKRLCPIHLEPVELKPVQWLLEHKDYVYPIFKGSIYNAVIVAATDLFADALLPSSPPSTWRIYVCLSVAGVFSVRRTLAGVTVTENLNNGQTLTANSAYMFDILVDVSETINFRTSVGATILKMSVWELPKGSLPPQGSLILPVPVPVTDNGGSLTVDFTVPVPVTDNAGSLTVDFTTPVPVNDNGGSLTVDGAVTVTGTLTQSTKHDATTYYTTNRVSLNANGNVLAGVAGKKIVVHSVWGQGTANIEGDIQDGAGGTNLIHFKFNDREGFVLPPWEYPGFWSKTTANTALYITFTTAGQSYWTITYSLE